MRGFDTAHTASHDRANEVFHTLRRPPIAVEGMKNGSVRPSRCDRRGTVVLLVCQQIGFGILSGAVVPSVLLLPLVS